MTFDEILKQVLDLLQREGRVSYRALRRRFDLDAEYLEDLKAELIDAKQLAVDEDGKVLVWSGQSSTPVAPAPDQTRAPLADIPGHLAEKILQSRTTLEGERKQVTVLFADLKGSLELLADRDPEEARRLLDPVLERMIEAVHRYEGTVNQVMGDGIMALFGAPLAHEDHAVRACYAALRMQDSVTRYGDELQRSQGVPVQIRVGLNAGEVVVRAIDSSLHMDYTAVGHTTHLAARMEQMAKPGSVLITADTLRLAEGLIQIRPLGAVPVKGLAHPVEVCELTGAMPTRTCLQAGAARGLTRFVGRQAELAALHQTLERTGSGHGQVVAVIGEPGVGKTRLFYEFTRAHRAPGWLLLDSYSVSYGRATPYLPVCDLLKVYFEIDERDAAREIREKVTGKLLTLDAALGLTVPALLALATASGEVVLQAQANQRLGQAYHAQGDYCRAIDCLRQSMVGFDGAPRREHFGQVLLPTVLSRAYLAWCHAELGTFAEGRTLGEEGLRIAEEAAHPGSLMYAYHGIGLLVLRQGDLPRALPALERAVGLIHDADLSLFFPWIAAALGAAYALAGRSAYAVPLLTQALEQATTMETVFMQALCSLPLGEAQLLAGRREEAHNLAEQALALARTHQERGYQTYALRLLGDIAAQREPPERDQAEAHYRQALTLADELGMRPLQAHCHRSLGTLYANIGQQEQARVELETAIALYRAMEMTFWLPQAEAALVQVEGR